MRLGPLWLLVATAVSTSPRLRAAVPRSLPSIRNRLQASISEKTWCGWGTLSGIKIPTRRRRNDFRNRRQVAAPLEYELHSSSRCRSSSGSSNSNSNTGEDREGYSEAGRGFFSHVQEFLHELKPAGWVELTTSEKEKLLSSSSMLQDRDQESEEKEEEEEEEVIDNKDYDAANDQNDGVGSEEGSGRRILNTFKLLIPREHEGEKSSSIAICLHRIPKRVEDIDFSFNLSAVLTKAMRSAPGVLFQEDKNNDHRQQQQHHQHISRRVIHVWEDQWIVDEELVKSRLRSITGATQRVGARTLDVKRVNDTVLRKFLQKHHMNAATRARYKYGLFNRKKSTFDEQLLAIASFSGMRKFDRDIPGLPPLKDSRSHEMIRHCTVQDYTILGGLSKLIKAFERDTRVEDIVTFSCMDWSDGQNYLKLGFTITERIPPYCFWINQTGKVRTYERQLPESLFEEFKESEACAQHYPDFHPKRRNNSQTQCPEAKKAWVEFMALHGWYPIHTAGTLKMIRVVERESNG